VSGPRHELQELLDWLQGVRKRQMFLGFDPSAWTYLYDIPVWYAIHICFVASFSSAAIARPMFTCVWPQGGGQLQWEQRRAGWIACHDRYRAPTRIYILEEDIEAKYWQVCSNRNCIVSVARQQPHQCPIVAYFACAGSWKAGTGNAQESRQKQPAGSVTLKYNQLTECSLAEI
jgi:hypothetical protein